MKIKQLNKTTTYTSKIICYTLEIKDKKIKIAKRWFFDTAINEIDWEGIKTKDKNFIEKLNNTEKDELDNFIDNLN